MNNFFVFPVFIAQIAFCQTVKPLPTICTGTMANAIEITDVNDNNIYSLSSVEKQPEFPGGLEAFYKSFADEFKISKEDSALNGRIHVSFVIEKDGSLSDIKMLRDLGFGSGKETIRVLRQLPKWIPAKNNNKSVRCSYSLPIKIPYETSKLTTNQSKKIDSMPDKN